MAAPLLERLPLPVVDDHRIVDRLLARALHVALQPRDVTAADTAALVGLAEHRPAAVRAAFARIERALAEERSAVVARAAEHLRRAVEAVDAAA